MAIDGYYTNKTKRDTLAIGIDSVEIARELVRRNPELSLDTACRIIASAALSLDVETIVAGLEDVANAIDEWRKRTT